MKNLIILFSEHKVKGDDEKQKQIHHPYPQHKSKSEEKPKEQYLNGNIRFEMVGDSSQLFEAEDFQKVKVNELKNINPHLEKTNDGSVQLEIIGDTSHLFEPEDFEKIEVKPLGMQEEIKTEPPAATDKNDSKDYDQHLDGQIVNGIDKNDSISVNDSAKNSDDEKAKGTVECNLKNFENNENKVKILNGTALTSMLAESKPNDCLVVMFYVPWCPFSARLAPHYNALPRAFKQLDIVAFDVSKSTG